MQVVRRTEPQDDAHTHLTGRFTMTTNPVRPDDPFQALDDLMVVIEALCPEWPERPPLTETAGMLL